MELKFLFELMLADGIAWVISNASALDEGQTLGSILFALLLDRLISAEGLAIDRHFLPMAFS